MAPDKLDQVESLLRTVLHLRSSTQLMTRKVLTGMDPWLQQMLTMIRSQATLSDLIQVDNLEDDVKNLEEKVRAILEFKSVSKAKDAQDDIFTLYTVSAAS